MKKYTIILFLPLLMFFIGAAYASEANNTSLADSDTLSTSTGTFTDLKNIISNSSNELE